jgi:hypothetical protein
MDKVTLVLVFLQVVQFSRQYHSTVDPYSFIHHLGDEQGACQWPISTETAQPKSNNNKQYQICVVLYSFTLWHLFFQSNGNILYTHVINKQFHYFCGLLKEKNWQNKHTTINFMQGF